MKEVLIESLRKYASKGMTVPSGLVIKLHRQFAPDLELGLFTLNLRSILSGLCVDNPTIRIIKGSIRVLTDAEAAEYLPNFFESGKKRMRRSLRKARSVDTSNLPQEQFDTFQENLKAMTVQTMLINRKVKAIDIFQQSEEG